MPSFGSGTFGVDTFGTDPNGVFESASASASASSSVTQESVAAQFFEDFEDYSTGVDLTTVDWTLEWNNSFDSWSEETLTDDQTGHFLASGGSNGWAAVSWDELDTWDTTDTEVVFKVTNNIDENLDQGHCIIRGSGGTNPDADGGYKIGFDNGGLEIVYIDGTGFGTQLGSDTGINIDTGTYWVRARVNGSDLKARAWQDGNAEPGTWNIEVTDSNVTADGFVGFTKFHHSQNPPDFNIRRVGIGTGGATAPKTDTAFESGTTPGTASPSIQESTSVSEITAASSTATPSSVESIIVDITQFDREKPLEVASVSGTPTVSKAQPIFLTDGDDSTTGTGQVVIDFTNISDETDIAVYDENDSVLQYEVEELDTTNNTALLWVWDDWVRDGSVQAKVAYGNGPATVENSSGTWNNSGQNCELVYHLSESSGPIIDSGPNGYDGTVEGATLGANGQFADAADLSGSDSDKISTDATNPAPHGSSEFTMLCWANTNVTGEDSTIVGQQDGTNSDEDTGIRTDASGFDGGGTNVYTYNVRNQSGSFSSAESADGSWTTGWHQLGLRWVSGNSPELIIDASLDSPTDSAASLSGSLALPDFGVGYGPKGNSGSMDGVADSVRLYSESKSTEWFAAEWDASAEQSYVFYSQQSATSTTGTTVSESGAAAASSTPIARERFGEVFFGYVSDWDSLVAESNVSHPDDELEFTAEDASAETATKQFE